VVFSGLRNIVEHEEPKGRPWGVRAPEEERDAFEDFLKSKMRQFRNDVSAFVDEHPRLSANDEHINFWCHIDANAPCDRNQGGRN
jgi:hypothetical protein